MISNGEPKHDLFQPSKGIDLFRYVPKPRPGVFRITKTNHNILQGVSDSSERLSSDSQQQLIDWIEDNAERYWTQRGGPLCRTSDGGADVVIVDDSQMPRLVSIAKEIDRQRPVIFRSHIQLRSDLIAVPGSPREEVWNFLWEHLREADVFISHPVARFVPRNIPSERVGYMPACTDWYSHLQILIHPALLITIFYPGLTV